MTIPYSRIKSRIDYREIACLLCAAITLHSVIDHCHEHGWTRGVLCVGCNNRMARVDADLRIATPAELFHRDNCPECRREGFAGVSRRLATPQPPVTRTVKRVARHEAKAKRLRATLPDLAVACRRHATAAGVAPESLTRGQIKEAARASGYSVSSDRVTHVAALLRGTASAPSPDVTPPPSGLEARTPQERAL